MATKLTDAETAVLREYVEARSTGTVTVTDAQGLPNGVQVLSYDVVSGALNEPATFMVQHRIAVFEGEGTRRIADVDTGTGWRRR